MIIVPRTPAPAFEPYEEADAASAPGTQARLTSFYLSRDRVLGLLQVERLPPHVLAVLQGHDVPMAAAILSNAVGTYLLQAIAAGAVKTLPQLAFEGGLRQGAQFIYNGHFSGGGFGDRNKTPALTLMEKLDEPLADKKLVFEFSRPRTANTSSPSWPTTFSR